MRCRAAGQHPRTRLLDARRKCVERAQERTFGGRANHLEQVRAPLIERQGLAVAKDVVEAEAEEAEAVRPRQDRNAHVCARCPCRSISRSADPRKRTVRQTSGTASRKWT